MPGGKNTKGSRRERELVNAADDLGLGAERIPASGSASGRDLPDVKLGRPVEAHRDLPDEGLQEAETLSDLYAIEAKASNGDPIYLELDEVHGLIRYARTWGAKPKVGVRFDAKRGDPHWGNDEDSGWRFFDPEDLHRTPSGNYRVKKETALSEGTPLEDL